MVRMAMIAAWFKIDEERIVQALQEAGEKLDSIEGEVALDRVAVWESDPLYAEFKRQFVLAGA